MHSASRRMFVGVDCGTQSTKVVVVDGDNGTIVARGASPHTMIPGLPAGHAEQHPEDWFRALESALVQALGGANVSPLDLRGIGVSAQQHGFVPLDADGSVIRPAKLWCDTSTAPQCDAIISRIGGVDRLVSLSGNGLPPGFTASKIRWLQEVEPANYARLATVLLPHDYLNYRLTGRLCMECGDASGTGFLDIRTRTWQSEVIEAIVPGLRERLPPLLPSDQSRGVVRRELAERWNLRDDVVVAPGGGDNMMSAIGTGNVSDGVVTVSLGTSGTIFAYSSAPIIDPRGEIAAFCDSTGAWLPLACTMNVTIATEFVKQLFGMDSKSLENAVRNTPAGADGLLLVPYFEGERTPNVPAGSGVWFGANRRTQTPAHFARAAMEGATLGLAYGLERLRALGVNPEEMRLTGGGANSPSWRQICADVFNTPVVCLDQDESAAYGAAIQAKWIADLEDGSESTIQQIAGQWTHAMTGARIEPDSTNVARYAELRDLHDTISQSLRAAFDRHRSILIAEEDV